MVFSSLLFLCLFLPITLGLYFISKNTTYRNVILLIASLIFYAWGEPVWIIALLVSVLVSYFHGFIIDRYRGRWQSRAALISSVAINLAILVFFKYMGFFVKNVNFIFHTGIEFQGFALPLGISFYTFQTLSYTVDVYRNEAKLQKSFFKLLLYISMFPQLVAGPIVRYVDVAEQIEDRRTTPEAFEYGIVRFIQGMFKKIIIANGTGEAVSLLLGNDLSALSIGGAWLGILLYAFQIYFDFSGYSDMAIGMGSMFGFRFRENFNYPYMSASITEFWRRWHISLGSFFRDYVYIPLGGNRRHQVFNLLVVWFLTGFWHGASWNFILWGLYYGVLLIIEKKVLLKILDKLPKVIRMLYSNILILIGWAIFYFTDLSKLQLFFRAALGLNASGNGAFAKYVLSSNIWLILLALVCSTPLIRWCASRLRSNRNGVYTALLSITVAAVMGICFALLVEQSYNPFLYFRF